MKKLGKSWNSGQHGMQVFDCDSSLWDSAPDLTITLGGRVGSLSTFAYTIPKTNWLQKDGNKCTLKFMNDPK